MPERINRTALGAMMARDPLHDGFRLLVARGAVALHPNQVENSHHGLGIILCNGMPTVRGAIFKPCRGLEHESVDVARKKSSKIVSIYGVR